MKYFAGLDVSLEETSICIVDETGKICRDAMVVSYPNDLADVLAGVHQFVGLARLFQPCAPFGLSRSARGILSRRCASAEKMAKAKSKAYGKKVFFMIYLIWIQN